MCWLRQYYLRWHGHGQARGAHRIRGPRRPGSRLCSGMGARATWQSESAVAARYYRLGAYGHTDYSGLITRVSHKSTEGDETRLLEIRRLAPEVENVAGFDDTRFCSKDLEFSPSRLGVVLMCRLLDHTNHLCALSVGFGIAWGGCMRLRNLERCHAIGVPRIHSCASLNQCTCNVGRTRRFQRVH